MDRHQFKEHYEEWMSKRDWNYGPKITPKQGTTNEELRRAVNLLDANLPEESEIYKDGPRIFNMRSPWEASFILSLAQSNLGVANSERIVFRGQKRTSWPLISSIDRLKVDDDAFSRARMEYLFLIAILKNLSIDLTLFMRGKGTSLKLMLPIGAYIPVAQHYGVPTSLLDFTADPSVAVYFASRDSKDIPNQTASVYCYAASSLMAIDGAVNIRFAPPFFQRPYLQKGIFVEHSESCLDFKNVVQPDFEIRFPIRKDNAEFRVIRSNGEVEMEPELPEMAELKSLALNGRCNLLCDHAGESFSSEEIFEYAKHYAEIKQGEVSKVFRKQRKDSIKYLLNFVDSIEDMLYWLCYHEINGGIKINLGILDFVVKSNPEIFRMMISMYRTIIRGDFGHRCTSSEIASKQQLINAFAASLKRAGERHTFTSDELWQMWGVNTKKRRKKKSRKPNLP